MRSQARIILRRASLIQQMVLTKLRLTKTATVVLALWLTSLSANVASAQNQAPDRPVLPSDGSEAPGLPVLRTELTVPVQSEPSAAVLDRSKGQDWHRSTMLLAGSMCPACLIELEGHLRELPGIAYAKVARQATAQNLAGAEPAEAGGGQTSANSSDNGKNKQRVASAVIIFDNRAVKFDGLLTLIKNEKYKARDVLDVVFADK